MQINKLLFFVGLSLITGFIWGMAFHVGDPRRIGQYDQMASIDIVEKGNNIWIIDHKTGQLIFEYNRFKEADKVTFKEYDDLLKDYQEN